jgi:hypothetical protein
MTILIFMEIPPSKKRMVHAKIVIGYKVFSSMPSIILYIEIIARVENNFKVGKPITIHL